MGDQKSSKRDKPFVWVKDRDGNEFVCAISALKDPDQLTDEEKAQCVDAVGPRGLVSPL